MRRFLIASVISSMALIGAGCLGGDAPQSQPVTLTYWRMTDRASDLDPVIQAYQETHPQVTIKVTVIPSDQYEKNLLTALAEDRGPDMFSLPQTWLKGWRNKLTPMPKERSVIERDQNQQGQTVTQLRKKPATSLLQLERDFVEVVPNTIVLLTAGETPADPLQRRIYGMPYSVDTLAMYYNRDLLTNANFSGPAQSWGQLTEQSRVLTRIDDDGNLEQSGVAMGGSNVRNGAELLAVLMMQNGAPMSRGGTPAFDRQPPGWDQPYSPGIVALRFYRSFGNENNSNWSWDRDFSGSLDQFVAGKTAYYFGFPEDALQIRARAPRLDLGLAPLPQVNPASPVNLALFPVEVVSAKSRHADYAWDFLVFASQADQVKQFLDSTNRPTALRALISDQVNDPEVSPFASQVLTAESWYEGYDYPKTQEIFLQLADQEVLEQDADLLQLIQAQNQVQQTYIEPRR